ncbi:hypothetical protein ACM66B_002309 [Microbotryomycetes sp. NB124-2]
MTAASNCWPRHDQSAAAAKWGRSNTDLVIRPQADVGVSDAYSTEDTPEQAAISSDLPTEIILCILQAVELLPDDDRIVTLYSLSLVSHAFSGLAQQSLHKYPHLLDKDDALLARHGRSHSTVFPRFQSLLKTLERRPDLARTVRSLPLGTWTHRIRTHYAHVDRRRTSEMSIAFVLLCRRISSLNFPGVVIIQQADLFGALRGLDSLESLTLGAGLSTDEDPWVIHLDAGIQETWGSARWSVRELSTLIECWPTLKHVKLSARLRTGNNVHHSSVPWTCRLESFELALIKNFRLSFNYVDALLANSTTTLTNLKITEHQMELQGLTELIRKYGPNLRHLETTTNDLHQRSTLVKVVSDSCDKLESLVLGSPVDPVEALESLSTLRQLRSVSLEVGRLDRAVLSSTYNSLISFIVSTTTDALSRFSGLEKLELTWRTTGLGRQFQEREEFDLSDSVQFKAGFKAPMVKITVIHL